MSDLRLQNLIFVLYLEVEDLSVVSREIKRLERLFSARVKRAMAQLRVKFRSTSVLAFFTRALDMIFKCFRFFLVITGEVEQIFLCIIRVFPANRRCIEFTLKLHCGT